jgi:hypothetical protein
MSENFNGKGPDFKEMYVRARLHFVVISYTIILFEQNIIQIEQAP